jgi:predicted dinucleotide-binding enzyme
VLPAAEQVEHDSGALPAVLVCSKDAGAKAFAMALIKALGRRTLDPGSLQSLRYLDPQAMRMYTEVQ